MFTIGFDQIDEINWCISTVFVNGNPNKIKPFDGHFPLQIFKVLSIKFCQ